AARRGGLRHAGPASTALARWRASGWRRRAWSGRLDNKPAAAAAIEVRGLTRRFGQFVAVDNIAFEVRRGEIFGFLGSTGAGKSTTIRMLCGLLKPTSGTAIVGA